MNLWGLRDALLKSPREYRNGTVVVTLTFESLKELESTAATLRRIDDERDNRDRMG